jgi:hypothetical protein
MDNDKLVGILIALYHQATAESGDPGLILRFKDNILGLAQHSEKYMHINETFRLQLSRVVNEDVASFMIWHPNKLRKDIVPLLRYFAKRKDYFQSGYALLLSDGADITSQISSEQL